MRFHLSAPTSELLELLLQCLPPEGQDAPVEAAAQIELVLGEPGTQRAYQLVHDGALARLSAQLEELLDGARDAMEWHLAEHSPSFVFVHSGVVATRSGRVVVVPGVSGSGKTSLVTALLRRGAAFYSDEYAVLDDSGFVHPYLRPLHVKSHGGRVVVDPHGAAEAVGGAPASITCVAAVKWAGDRASAIQKITPGDAALELMKNAPAARASPDKVLDVVSRAIRGASAWRGVRGDADEFADWLLEALER